MLTTPIFIEKLEKSLNYEEIPEINIEISEEMKLSNIPKKIVKNLSYAFEMLEDFKNNRVDPEDEDEDYEQFKNYFKKIIDYPKEVNYIAKNAYFKLLHFYQDKTMVESDDFLETKTKIDLAYKSPDKFKDLETNIKTVTSSNTFKIIKFDGNLNVETNNTQSQQIKKKDLKPNDLNGSIFRNLFSIDKSVHERTISVIKKRNEKYNDARFFVVENYKSVIDQLFAGKDSQDYGMVSEIMSQDVKLILDLDDKDNKLTKKSFVELTEKIAELVPDFFKSYFAESLPENAEIIFKPVFLYPQPWNYNSCHLIFNISVNNKLFCFADASLQKMFWSSFFYNFKSEHIKNRLDLNIYRRNGFLRMPYSYKNDQMLIPRESDNFEIKDLYACVRDDNGNFLINSNELFIYLQPLSYDNKRKYWTTFEQNEILRIIRNSSKNISKRKDWLAIIKIIISAFKHKGLAFVTKLVIRICSAAGFDSEKDFSENIRTVELFFHITNMSFRTAKKIVKANLLFSKVDEAERIDYSIMPKSDLETVVVKSGCGTGKSFNFMMNNKSGVFYVTHRMSLGKDYFKHFNDERINIKASYYGNYDQEEKQYFFLKKTISEIDGKATEEQKKALEDIKRFSVIENDENLYIPANFVCQLNSLHKYKKLLPYYQKYFFDESAATFKMLNFAMDNLKGSMLINFRLAFDYIMRNKSIFCVSANIGYETFNLLEYYGRKPTFAYKNKKKNKSDYYYHLYEDEGEFFYKVVEFLKEGKKIIMPCNFLKKACELDKKIKELSESVTELGKKVLIISRLTKEEDLTTDSWKNYDLVIYTSKIDSGVSYEGYEEIVNNEKIKNCHFDKICGYFKKGLNDSESCFQSLWRCRNPRDKDMHIFCSYTTPLKCSDWDSKENIVKQINLAEEYSFESHDMLSPLDKIYLDNAIFQNHDRIYFQQNFLKLLHKTGIKNITHTRDNRIIDENGKVAKVENINVITLKSTGAINEYKMANLDHFDSVFANELNKLFCQIDDISADMLIISETDSELAKSEKKRLRQEIIEQKRDFTESLRVLANKKKIKAGLAYNHEDIKKILEQSEFSEEDKIKLNTYRYKLVDGKYVGGIVLKNKDKFLVKVFKEFYVEKKQLNIEDFLKYFENKFELFNNLFPNARKKTLEDFKKSKIQYKLQYLNNKFEQYGFKVNKNNVGYFLEFINYKIERLLEDIKKVDLY